MTCFPNAVITVPKTLPPQTVTPSIRVLRYYSDKEAPLWYARRTTKNRSSLCSGREKPAPRSSKNKKPLKRKPGVFNILWEIRRPGYPGVQGITLKKPLKPEFKRFVVSHAREDLGAKRMESLPAGDYFIFGLSVQS